MNLSTCITAPGRCEKHLHVLLQIIRQFHIVCNLRQLVRVFPANPDVEVVAVGAVVEDIPHSCLQDCPEVGGGPKAAKLPVGVIGIAGIDTSPAASRASR